MQSWLKELRWPVTRVSALDAKTNVEDVLSGRGQSITLPPSGIGWNPLRERLYSVVEEACFSSHMKALQMFLKSDARCALILEDDAEPQRDVHAQLEALLQIIKPCEIIKLEGGNSTGRRPALFDRACGTANVVRSFVPSSGSAAYLITRAAAAQLLSRAGRIAIPYDDYLSSSALHGVNLSHLSPWLFLQSDIASTMGEARAPHRHVKRRDPYHFVLQGWRRGRLRFLLWCDTLLKPKLSLALRLARW